MSKKSVGCTLLFAHALVVGLVAVSRPVTASADFSDQSDTESDAVDGNPFQQRNYRIEQQQLIKSQGAPTPRDAAQNENEAEDEGNQYRKDFTKKWGLFNVNEDEKQSGVTSLQDLHKAHKSRLGSATIQGHDPRKRQETVTKYRQGSSIARRVMHTGGSAYNSLYKSNRSRAIPSAVKASLAGMRKESVENENEAEDEDQELVSRKRQGTVRISPVRKNENEAEDEEERVSPHPSPRLARRQSNTDDLSAESPKYNKETFQQRLNYFKKGAPSEARPKKVSPVPKRKGSVEHIVTEGNRREDFGAFRWKNENEAEDEVSPVLKRKGSLERKGSVKRKVSLERRVTEGRKGSLEGKGSLED